MKLKRKLLLTSSILLVATTPVVAVISCGDSNKVNNNINDAINAQDTVIGLSSNDLIVTGKDGSGTFKFDVSPNQKKQLIDAKATYEYFVKYYKDGGDFQPLNTKPSTDINDKPILKKGLSVEDEIMVKVKVNKPGFVLKENGIYTKKITSSKGGLKINWYEPAISTVNADSMVSVVGDTMTINLDKDVKTNELVFKMAKELGYLFSDNPKRFVAKQSDNETNPITLKDIVESLEKAKTKGIKKIVVKSPGDADSTLNLDNMDDKLEKNVRLNITNLINEGLKFILPFKDAPLDDSKPAPESVFTSGGDGFKFATAYGSVAIPIKDKLLTMIGGMRNKTDALSFIPTLAIGYGNIFQWLIGTNNFIKWSNENRIRKTEIDVLPSVFMATLFRTNPNN
ncbi:MAG: hypothetical protein HRT98_02790 [Mycoplasmatales bacterium]|nr:hypothetical protein [Mycoplasmatales bacterium]